jgi:F-type H+-transporting ATPase subunit delta
LAVEQGALAAWSETLGLLAAIARDAAMATVITDPRIAADRLAGLVCEVGGERLTEHARNLVRVLAHNGRLGLLPEIDTLYEEERARAELRCSVQLVSAYPVDPDFAATVKAAMQRRLGCQVEVETSLDPSLIGGVVVRAGDLVIDASLRGRLSQLAARLA